MSTPFGRRLAVVGVAAVVMVAADLGVRVFANNDEARFALLAQGMMSHGSWWSPTLNGHAYYNKPPLLAWLIALASLPAGHVTQLTAVLPSAAACVGTALLLYLLGCELFGRDAGTYAALVAITTQGFFLHARLPMPDMLMTFFVTASVVMLWRLTRDRPGPSWLGFYALLGAAFWAKGPAGLLPLALAFGWAAAGGDAGRWRRLHLPAGIVVLAAVLAPWGWLALARGSEIRHGIASDQFLWYLPGVPTLGAFVAPLQNVFSVLFPWVLVVPFALVQAAKFLRGSGSERDGVSFVGWWAAVTLALVAVSREQRLRYYLPLVPPVSLLIGWWWAGAVVRHRHVIRIPGRLYVAGAALLAIASGAALALRGRWPKEIDIALPTSLIEVVVLAGAMTLAVAAVIDGILRDRLRRRFGIAWVGSAVLLLAGYHWAVERRNLAYDYAGMYERIRPVVAAAPVVGTWGLQELPLALYFGRPVVAVTTAAELRQILSAGAVALLTGPALAHATDPALTVLAHDRGVSSGVAVVVSRPAAGEDAVQGRRGR